MSQGWAVILAGGKGTRMGDGLKKEAHIVGGRTMIASVFDTVSASGLQPLLVVEKEDSVLRDIVGHDKDYVIQSDAAGPVEALRLAIEALPQAAERVVIACGDQPFFSVETMQALDQKIQTGLDFALASFIVPNDAYYQQIYHGGAELHRNGQDDALKIFPPHQADVEASKTNELAQPIYAAKVPFLRRMLSELPIGHEKQFNFAAFLNQVIALGKVGIYEITDPEEGIGFNTNTDIQAYEQRRA